MADRRTDCGVPGRVDHVVVGAGVLGLAATRALGRRGRSVVCLEQQSVGHNKCGSKGTARIFRCGYDDVLYVRLALRSRLGFEELAAESGETLLQTTGMLSFGGDEGGLLRAMAEGGAEAEALGRSDIESRFPAFRGKASAVHERGAGVLRADRVLSALRHSVGNALVEGARVTAISEGDGRVEVMAEATSFTCGSVVVCAGPWSSELLEVSGSGVTGGDWSSTFRPTLQQVAYYRARDEMSVELPAFVEFGERTYYGLLDPARRLYKVGNHEPGRTVSPSDADFATDDASEVKELSEVVARLLPSFDPVPVETERCLYDNTPDEDFVLDRIGRVVIGAGTSGHGFKFAPLLGELLADLAEGRSLVGYGDRFSLARFGGGLP